MVGMLKTILQQVTSHGSRSAIIAKGRTSTYDELVSNALALSGMLQGMSRPVLFMTGRNHFYAVAQWGIWNAGTMAVPLYQQHPARELEYIAEDSQASVVVVDAECQPKIDPIAARCRLNVVRLEDNKEIAGHVPLLTHAAELDRPAMMLYTSGTTGRPKGVVHTHRNLSHHVTDLVNAWDWTDQDYILHVLPLHHAHGIINKFLCPMWAGARCEFLESPDAIAIWTRLADTQEQSDGAITVFMAVPTVFHRLLHTLPQLDSKTRSAALHAVRSLRLTVCGSAACPPSVINAWERLTGHRLLERYGMTELGMVLSNPLHGPRHVGYVGQPLPSVEVHVVDGESGRPVRCGDQGELRVKGPTVFREYWNRPEATAAAFDAGGWFKTGDVAAYDAERGSYRILGRASVDIIKSGGYKISALEVERELLEHPDVSECAVIGVTDAEFGEAVVAVVTLSRCTTLPVPYDTSLRQWAKSRLAGYKLPREVRVVSEIAKNAMGKVNKRELTESLR